MRYGYLIVMTVILFGCGGSGSSSKDKDTDSGEDREVVEISETVYRLSCGSLKFLPQYLNLSADDFWVDLQSRASITISETSFKIEIESYGNDECVGDEVFSNTDEGTLKEIDSGITEEGVSLTIYELEKGIEVTVIGFSIIGDSLYLGVSPVVSGSGKYVIDYNNPFILQ